MGGEKKMRCHDFSSLNLIEEEMSCFLQNPFSAAKNSLTYAVRWGGVRRNFGCSSPFKLEHSFINSKEFPAAAPKNTPCHFPSSEMHMKTISHPSPQKNFLHDLDPIKRALGVEIGSFGFPLLDDDDG